MARIEPRTRLDPDVLAEILELIDAATRADGHRPVGEHKYAHLREGADGWVGILAHTGDLLVGYAHLRWNPLGDRPRLAVEVVVHPDHRDGDVARALLDATRDVVAGAGGGLMFLWVHRVEDARTTLAARMGFEVQRELAFMSRPLPERPRFVAPEGVLIRPYRPGADDDELLRVNNAAFEGHPENGGWGRDELRARLDRDWFDPDGLLTAWQGERLAGFHWTKWHGHDSDEVPAHEPVGEVYVLATDPSGHGRGLGRALLRAGLAHLHDRGCRLAILYVDSASTPAANLYTSEGFSTQYLEVCYQEEIPAVAAGDDLARPAF